LTLDTVVRIGDVCAATKLSRSTIWRLERDGRFPRRVKLSIRAVGWRAADIEAWLKTRCDAQGAAPLDHSRRAA